MQFTKKPIPVVLSATLLMLALCSTPSWGTPKPAAKTEPASETPNKKPTMKDVQRLYDAGRYKDVLKAVRHLKPTPMTHYYTGLAYQGLNQTYRAAVEYNYASRNAIDPKLKSNAARALKALYRVKRKKKVDYAQLQFDRERTDGDFSRPEYDYPSPSGSVSDPYLDKALNRIKNKRWDLKNRTRRDRFGKYHNPR